MSQSSGFRLLALVTLFAGLVGCAPLPIGSDSESNAMLGERLSSQNAPSPAKRRVASQNSPLPHAAPSSEWRVASAQDAALPPAVSSKSSASSRTVPAPPTDSPTMESLRTTRFASSRDSADVSDDAMDYIITSQDVLQVSVFQVPDLARTVRVDGSGAVSLPLVGRVPVRGKSILQAQEDIAARYGKSYLQSPQVTLSLVRSGQRVTVNGAVKNPTVLTLDGTLTLSMAIAQSGGLNELGNSTRVHVARPTGQQVEDFVYNLDDIQAGKSANPILRGGDIVVVEESNTKLALKNMKDVLPFAAIGAFLSDARVKRDITPIAKWENGLQLYRYRYAWSDTLYVGVLAQEVLEVAPNAVSRGADGYLRVHYARLGLRLQPWKEWITSNPDVKFLSRPAPTH
jgi:polysaccharide biosynthesis/export protein